MMNGKIFESNRMQMFNSYPNFSSFSGWGWTYLNPKVISETQNFSGYLDEEKFKSDNELNNIVSVSSLCGIMQAETSGNF
jgi:hypothetical protein